MVDGVQVNVILHMSHAKISQTPPRFSVLAQRVEPGNKASYRIGTVVMGQTSMYIQLCVGV